MRNKEELKNLLEIFIAWARDNTDDVFAIYDEPEKNIDKFIKFMEYGSK